MLRKILINHNNSSFRNFKKFPKNFQFDEYTLDLPKQINMNAKKKMTLKYRAEMQLCYQKIRYENMCEKCQNKESLKNITQKFI